MGCDIMLTFIIAEVEEITDQQFMLELYKTHKARMVKNVREYVFEEDYVEDVIQESVARLCRNVKTLKQLERCKLEAYIVYTVKHTAFSHNDKMKREKAHLIYDEDDKMLSLLRTSERFVEEELLQAEKIAKIRSILKRLPDNEQDIIIRRYYLKQSDFEIAEAHGLRADSIRMKLTRIRRKFFEMMKEEGVTYEIT